jgi:hypothetical protein
VLKSSRKLGVYTAAFFKKVLKINIQTPLLTKNWLNYVLSEMFPLKLPDSSPADHRSHLIVVVVI